MHPTKPTIFKLKENSGNAKAISMYKKTKLKKLLEYPCERALTWCYPNIAESSLYHTDWNSLEEESHRKVRCTFSPDHSDWKWIINVAAHGGKMGKKKITHEGRVDQMVLPSKNDVLGIAVKMLGGERIMVKCQDGKERLCRIRGKMKRRVWIRDGDVVLVSPWDFQTETRGDIFFRYRQNQASWLREHNYITI
jgi:translation initiation factor 1A